MYQRLCQWPKNTSFLFGPRGTGKSSWIKTTGKARLIIDLLPSSQFLSFNHNPELFRAKILAEASPTDWIVVDEIQRIPKLLDEIHILFEQHGYRNFLLTGSSARKLRKSVANLLGGRARNLNFYPLTSFEIDFNQAPEDCYKYGMLPMSVTELDKLEKELFLKGYVENYLIDEIKRESQIKNLDGFQRFLQCAAICSTQPINFQNIARDAKVSRDSVLNYFELLEDTLIGFKLPAFAKRIKVKQVQSPKFYFFDSGVLNCAAGYFEQAAPRDWQGYLMETWIAHELRAYLDLNRIKGQLSYWRTSSGTEVDFVWNYGEKIVLIEVKSGKTYRKDFLDGIHSFRSSKVQADAYVVYLGNEKLKIDGVNVLPAHDFLKKMYSGEVFQIPEIHL